ncbi:MAG: hypothetical protein A2992_08300 [Elusimicrobia bacterium RIFCSPLOWO2_01_FULL_59_12]|nr:MAG: hypothetical protein A2992_08300 [Elusimicrobia bacterium RIFCSPLOWO2_01_FULL_59_12]
MLGTTIYSFALIVAVYLLATWMGSAAYRRAAAPASAPAGTAPDLEKQGPGAARGKVLSLPTLLAALSVFSLFPIAVNDPRLGLWQFGIVAGIFPFSFLLGYLTPSLIDRYSQGDPNNAGRAYAVNILGCILGPLLASYLFLPTLGAKGSMILMAIPYGLLFAACFSEVKRPLRNAAGAAAGILLASALWINRSYEERYNQCIIRRDSTATVISMGSGMQRRLLVNGVGITQLTTITKVMAHLPMLVLKEKPASALNICFGMGTTYRSLLRWDGLRVTAVELVPSVKEAFGYYHDDAARVLSNPLGTIVIDDGRRFLRRTSETFDLVTLDPPPPIEAAGSSLLYAKEFYTLVKKRLTPSGVVQQWFPGGPGVEFEGIARALTESFPYVRAYVSMDGWGVHFLCSMQPFRVPSAEACAARVPKAVREDLLEWEPRRTVTDLFKLTLKQELPILEMLERHHDAVAISDDRPINEYYMIRRAIAHYRRTGHL